MFSAVVTTVAGRVQHLAAQRAMLATVSAGPDLHVVVAVGDTPVVEPAGELVPTVVVGMPSDAAGMPVAAARNAGAREALRHGAELLIFLDVDCLPGEDLVGRYRDAAVEHPEALLAGPVTYLPPAPRQGWTAAALETVRRPHPARPDPPAGQTVDGDHALFWSLSFAVRAPTWTALGGFDEAYVGYGAEDTDLGQRARTAGVALHWVGGADAFHQHHPTTRPPLAHVDDVVRNGRRFADRWGWWPMDGWLTAFEDLGAVRRDGPAWVRTPPMRVLTFPSEHPYLDAVRPATTVRAPPLRGSPWAPDPLFDPDALATVRDEVDLVHVHFGFDHLTAADLGAWANRVHHLGLPLVVTVHDLRNPHHLAPQRHDALLGVLLAAADRVITLTDGAAAAITARYRVRPLVLPHPTTQPEPGAPVPTETGLVVVALKSLRANVVEPAAVVAAVLDGARRTGGRVRVDVHPEVRDVPELAEVHRLATGGELELCVHDRYDDDQLIALLDRAHVSVLPYRFGTHSGWLELCRDRGTRVVVPSCGYFAEQWSDVLGYDHDEHRGLDAGTLSTAVAAALTRPPPEPADRGARLQQRDEVRLAHARLYADLRGRGVR